jgi:uncharacterized integral membrane protein (TIGR00697 family)
MSQPSPQPIHKTRFLELFSGLFAGLLVISNLASTRLIEVGPFLVFDAGTLMFPLTYIFGDLLTEVYGYARARRVIWTAFLCQALAFLSLWLVTLFPVPPDGLEGAKAFDAVMGLVPRIALGSLIAFLIGEFTNSMVLSRMKKSRPGSSPAWRFIASTLAGQFLDTIIFASVAFAGLFPAGLWAHLVLSNYVYKVALEIVLLPLTLWTVRAIKRAEKLDTVDREVSLNPFLWKA